MQWGLGVVQVPVELLAELIGRQPDSALRQREQVGSALAQGVNGHALVAAQLFSGFGVVAVVGIRDRACVIAAGAACEAGPDGEAGDDRDGRQQQDDPGEKFRSAWSWQEGAR